MSRPLDSEQASLLLAKKGMPSAQDWKVLSALDEHRKVLSDPTPETEVQELVEEVQRTVDEIFSRRSGSDLPFRVPSASGHLESTRDDWGALGYLSGCLPEIMAANGDFDLLGLGRLYSEDPGEPGLDGIRRGANPPLWGLPPGDVYDWESSASELAKVLGGTLPLVPERASELAQALLESCWETDSEYGPHRCRAVAIPEALKVRVVTGGPEKPYYIASYIQKLVHGLMRNHPTFRLIGKSLQPEDVAWCVSGMQDGWVMNSGDYKKATDLLHRMLSVRCAERISERLGLGPRSREMFVSTLVSHSLSYEPSKFGGETREWFQQRRGQLMGSPTSFPVLCIVNAAISRRSLELSLGRRLSLIDTRMLVNGDDILFACPPEAISVWRDLTARAGLEMSVGKNFVSDKFCTVNSELYVIRRELDFFAVPYFLSEKLPAVNLGLLLGQNVKKGHGKSAWSHDTFRYKDLAQMAHKLLQGFSGTFADRLLTRFIRSWGDSLKRLPPGFSWFIPQCLGGLGLPWVRSGEPDLSEQQRKVATFMASPCSVEEHLRRKALVQERLGVKSLWEHGSRLLCESLREVGLGGLSFVDKANGRDADWIGAIVGNLFLSGEMPSITETDRNALLAKGFSRLWKLGTAHGMCPLSWDKIHGYQGLEVEIALPLPPPEWGIRVDALSH